MNIRLSDHFTYTKLLRFAVPSIGMMIFTSIYGVVDGYFVSNFVGKTSFASINFISPVVMILGTIGFMFGAGGSALISKTMGEGKTKKANQLFSLLIYTTIILGTILTIFGLISIRLIASVLGAEGLLLEQSVLYGQIVLIALPVYMLQIEFQTFLAMAEKPQLGLAVTIASGITNIIMDALFIVVFKWGIGGAAIATAFSQMIGGIVPLIYFSCPNSSLYRLRKVSYDGKALFKVCINGSSELMACISSSLVGILYNVQLIKYAGEDGVAAYGVLMYVNMVFLAAFIGYSNGTAPIVSYHYGAGNHSELKGLLRKSLMIIGLFSVCMFGLSEILAKPLSILFVGYNSELLKITLRGFLIFSFNFLFAGFGIYGSAFFTALNNGLISAAIAFLRTLVFQLGAILLLPIIWGVDGIWISIVVAEIMASFVSTLFIAKKRKEYHY